MLHARHQAEYLSPRKVPDCIVSVGNGIMGTTPNTSLNFISRFVRFSLESLCGHRQYQRLGGPAGEAFNEFRIDPALDMEAVALDDADAIGRLVEQLDRQFAVDPELNRRIKQLSLVMVASLFYFQFLTMPRMNRRGKIVCQGFVTCRYEDDPSITRVLATGFQRLSVIVAGSEYSVTADERTIVNFTLPSWSAPFDIRLQYRGKSCSITGFPQSADALLELQLHGCESIAGDVPTQKIKRSRVRNASIPHPRKKGRML